MSKKRKQKEQPITTLRVNQTLATYPDCVWSRLEICKAMGRKKTSWAVRVIDRAVDEGLAWRVLSSDDKTGLPIYLYSYVESVQDNAREYSDLPNTMGTDRMFGDGREFYDIPYPND